MNLPRKLQLIFGFLKALSGDWAASRRALAYRHYLASTFPQARFGSECIVGEGCGFEEGVNVGSRTTLVHSHVGRYSSIGFESMYVGCQIGRFCSLGPRVLAGLGRHPTDFVSTSPVFYAPHHSGVRISFVTEQRFDESLPISIGHDVWIGANAVLMDGIVIGSGAIIGAGAVVTRDVEPYAIVGGVPAKLIRRRFDQDVIEKLLNIHWWDKPLPWLQQTGDSFADIVSFLNAVEQA